MRWSNMLKLILDIKNFIDCYVGNCIVLKVNGGCKKIIKCFGILKEIYLLVFIVELDQDKYNFERVFYIYIDVLIENV